MQRPTRHRRGDEGMTLVEVMVAFSILIITLVPLTYLLTSVVASAADARQRQAALQLADSWLEVLSNSSLPTDPATGPSSPTRPQDPVHLPQHHATSTPIPKSTLAGTDFGVSANFTTQSVNNQGQSDLCSSGQPPSPSHPAVILLQVTVTWNKGNSSVTDTTAVNYPQPGLQTEGFLAVQLTNSGTTDVNGNSAADPTQRHPGHPDRDRPGECHRPVDLLQPLAHALLRMRTVACSPRCRRAPTRWPRLSPPRAQPQDLQPLPLRRTGVHHHSQQHGPDQDRPTRHGHGRDHRPARPLRRGHHVHVSYASSAAVDSGVACPGSTPSPVSPPATVPRVPRRPGAGPGPTGVRPRSPTSPISTMWPAPPGAPVSASGNASGAAAIRTTSSGLSTTNTDTNIPAGVTTLSQVVCPSANGCYALGTSLPSGPCCWPERSARAPPPVTSGAWWRRRPARSSPPSPRWPVRRPLRAR